LWCLKEKRYRGTVTRSERMGKEGLALVCVSETMKRNTFKKRRQCIQKFTGHAACFTAPPGFRLSHEAT